MNTSQHHSVQQTTNSKVIDGSEHEPCRNADLTRLLDLSRPEEEHALWHVLDGIGCQKIPDDLTYLRQEDLQQSALSKVTQRKLLQIQEYIELGGSLADVQSVRELKGAIVAKQKEESSSSQGDEEIIRLNVGGETFTTTRKTLCRVPGSMLASMFTRFADNPARQTADGTYVIDRDGRQFAHILNYLRVGAVVSLPEGRAARDALAMEADYYGLPEILGAIRMPLMDLTQHLPENIVDMWSEEARIRAAFVRDGGKNLDPHEGLVSVFGGGMRLPLRYTPFQGSDAMPTVMDVRQGSLTEDQPVTVQRLYEFETNFNKEFANVLPRLRGVLADEPVIIAGGSVLRALTVKEGLRPEEWWQSGKSDIDIFIHSSTPVEATRITKRIFYALTTNHERWVIVRGKGVVTIHSWDGHGGDYRIGRKIQVVLRLYDSPAEVLYGFDVDCCSCAYDGQKVWATPRCLLAIRSGNNILNPLHSWPNRPSYEIRLAKYANRGYAVAVPGLDMRRIDDRRIRAASLENTNGLARLIKVAFAVEKDSLAKIPDDPIHNVDLKEIAKICMSETEQLIGGYWQDDDVDGDIREIIVPPVYVVDGEDFGPTPLFWREGYRLVDEFFPTAGECRDDAWNFVENAEESSVRGLPDKLDDAWNAEKKSREYLNATMEKADLDSLYYDHAFEKAS